MGKIQKGFILVLVLAGMIFISGCNSTHPPISGNDTNGGEGTDNDNTAECSDFGGVRICLFKISSEKLNLAISVYEDMNVQPYNECNEQLLIEKKDGFEWKQINTTGYFGKGCPYFIGRNLTNEEINGHCWADYCANVNTLYKQNIDLNWNMTEFKNKYPNARDDPTKIRATEGTYRINFHGFTKEFQIK